MDVYKSIMQGLNEAVEHQQGKGNARTVKMKIRPVPDFAACEIKEIRQQTGLSQVMFAFSLGVSPKTVEAWECGRNTPEGASRRMLEIAKADPNFFTHFQE